MRYRPWVLVAVLILLLGAGLSVWAAPSQIAVLVVSQAGSETKAKAIIKKVTQLRSEAGLSADRLAVLGVKWENTSERQYCEQRLNIHADSLVFVGVVSLAINGVPDKVLFRVDRASDPSSDAQVAFLKAQSVMGKSHVDAVPTVTSTTSVTPGEEKTNAKDGSVMILVPAGSFTMGSDDSEGERPPHDVSLAAYYIGKYPVTNAQFRAFAQANNYEAAGDWEAYAKKWGDKAPVVDVSWLDAQAYCQWAGVRLPTEAEWEKAARGTDGRKYPWGNSWDGSRCRNGVAAPVTSAAAVGSYPAGASPYGCLDMVGNVWQWCSSIYKPYPYNAGDGREDAASDEHRVVRGGSWYNVLPGVFRVTHRIPNNPGQYGNNIGFRVAQTP